MNFSTGRNDSLHFTRRLPDDILGKSSGSSAFGHVRAVAVNLDTKSPRGQLYKTGQGFQQKAGVDQRAKRLNILRVMNLKLDAEAKSGQGSPRVTKYAQKVRHLLRQLSSHKGSIRAAENSMGRNGVSASVSGHRISYQPSSVSKGDKLDASQNTSAHAEASWLPIYENKGTSMQHT